MAVKGATPHTWLDWDKLAAAKDGTAVLCIPREVEEPQNFGNGMIEPVRTDVIVLTGEQAGEVHRGERVLAAGIRLKLADEIGNEIVGRIRPYGKKSYPGLEPEEPGDVELAEQALAKLMAEANTGVTSNGQSKAKATNKGAGPATAADDEPPF